MENTVKILDSIKSIIITVIGLALFIGIIVAIINAQINGSNKSEGMSIEEAQTKCMLMEEADMVNLMGEPFGSATTQKASQHCLSLWDRSLNPDNTDEKFIEMVTTDWESRKTEVLEGYTLEEYYNESTK